MWECACGEPLDRPLRICPKCGHETGISSNVVLAGEDQDSLMTRLDDVKGELSGNGADLERLDGYRERVSDDLSVSVNMQPEAALNLMSSQRIPLTNLHDNRRARVPVDPDRYADAWRVGSDALLFAADWRDLHFGALNLDNAGLTSYGCVCVFLANTDRLRGSASFLESNSFHYSRCNGPQVVLQVPAGARATWYHAPDLVVVKHYRDLLARENWTKKELADMVLHSDGDRNTDRFVEVQVAAEITSKDLDRVVYDPDSEREPHEADKLVGELSEHSRNLAKALMTSAKRRGLKFEIAGYAQGEEDDDAEE